MRIPHSIGWSLFAVTLFSVTCAVILFVPLVIKNWPQHAHLEQVRPPDYPETGVIDISHISLRSKPKSPGRFQPRKDLPPWNASIPIDWAADPFKDRNWQFHLHSWGNMEYWLHEFKRDMDASYLISAVAIALDWGRFHIGQKKKNSPFQWHDHATANRASRLAFLLDQILSSQLKIGNTELAALIGLADIHVKKLLDPKFLSRANHGLFQLVGLDMLCEVLSWRRVCRGARAYARSSFIELARGWFTVEGVHLENSPTYHGIVVRLLQKLGAAERFQHRELNAMLELAGEVAPWLTYPDGKWVPIGDSSGIGPKLKGPIEPICLEDGAGCWAFRDLTASGYANIRSIPESDASRASMLFISAMARAIGHKHADDLGFELMESGRRIFVDSGMYGYERDEARQYVTSARAHNVPSLADLQIQWNDVDPGKTHLEPIRVKRRQFVVKGVVDRPGYFLHEREFVYTPGTSLQIKDRLHNRTNSLWLSNLHLARDLVPEISGSGFHVNTDQLILQAEFHGDGCELMIVRGETEPYQGWISEAYLELTPAHVVSASCPPDLVESSWNITFREN